MWNTAAEKRSRLVVGLMSGTSADGIDAALVQISGSGQHTRIALINHKTYPHARALNEKILQVATAKELAVADLCGLNVILSRRFAEAALWITAASGYKNVDIDLIGCHGQTIRHLPTPWEFMGEAVSATWQMGDAAIIAKLTGITTVGDFRTDDVALGGQGAPLVPFLDYLLFRDSDEHRACLNLGGIGNITHIPARAMPADVIAFDTGPGNMLIDRVMLEEFAQPYDDRGQTAAQGRIHEPLLEEWLQDPYFSTPPPKSTGRERYGADFVEQIKRAARQQALNRYDLVATLTALTADAVWFAYTNFLQSRGSISRLYVSGGGSCNPMIMKRLQARFVGVGVVTTDAAGMPSAAKEAVCFAVLANETVHSSPANLPSVTGASRSAVLGKICQP